LDKINNVFDRLRHGRIHGRVVIDFNQKALELVGSGTVERAAFARHGE
jgi:hypothetical protein